MKSVLIFLTILAVGYAETKTFEIMDVYTYIDDKSALNKLYECITGAGACDNLEADFKARGEDIVRTNCTNCLDKEKWVTRDLLSLIAYYDIVNLHTVMEVFDPNNLNSESFLLYLQQFDSIFNIPAIPAEVIKEFRRKDDDGKDDGDNGDKQYKKGHYHWYDRFIRRGGLLGAAKRVLQAVRGVVGVYHGPVNDSSAPTRRGW